MNNRPNPVAIGVFVLVGLFLAVGALAFFSSTNFLSPKERFVLFFEDSIAGLDAGSTVKFKGVRIGQVVEVLIHFDPDKNDVRMPVIIEIDSRMLQSNLDKPLPLRSGDERTEMILSRLRGTLEMESFVTGLLYVGLDYYPKIEPIQLVSTTIPHREIGTLPSGLATFKKRLQEMDLVGISEKLLAVLESVDQKLRQLEVQKINDRLVGTLESVDSLLNSPEVSGGIKNLSETIKELRNLVLNLDSRVEPLSESLHNTQGEITKTLQDLQLAVREIRNLVVPHSPVLRHLQDSLAELSQTLKSIGELADYLKRNPRALLSGKPNPQR